AIQALIRPNGIGAFLHKVCSTREAAAASGSRHLAIRTMRPARRAAPGDKSMKPLFANLLRPAVAAALTFSCAVAAAFPERPVRIIVPFAAGGATDVIARTVAQEMAATLGQPVIVENRAGANGNIGASAAARADADGYTLLM